MHFLAARFLADEFFQMCDGLFFNLTGFREEDMTRTDLFSLHALQDILFINMAHVAAILFVDIQLAVGHF